MTKPVTKSVKAHLVLEEAWAEALGAYAVKHDRTKAWVLHRALTEFLVRHADAPSQQVPLEEPASFQDTPGGDQPRQKV